MDINQIDRLTGLNCWRFSPDIDRNSADAPTAIGESPLKSYVPNRERSFIREAPDLAILRDPPAIIIRHQVAQVTPISFRRLTYPDYVIFIFLFRCSNSVLIPETRSTRFRRFGCGIPNLLFGIIISM
jgi:hypothetical protein